MALVSNSPLLTDYSNLQVKASQVVLIYTEWNQEIITELCAGAQRILDQFPQVQVSAFQVPGCVEIPFAIQQHIQHHAADAYIAFGCVIRGETPHFDYVCQSVTAGITQLNVQQNSPVIFGILTVNDIQQAHDRIGGKHGHKGEEAAIAALKMISLRDSFLKGKPKI
ncbi:MAG: 6,7-dimethyl-8-ribityllumazine synthase [Chitinophagaceae bacterium]|nr:6,7-dimethyl-8-ribityllumazine synthase [Chitinophagaceae bacterium]